MFSYREIIYLYFTNMLEEKVVTCFKNDGVYGRTLLRWFVCEGEGRRAFHDSIRGDAALEAHSRGLGAPRTREGESEQDKFHESDCSKMLRRAVLLVLIGKCIFETYAISLNVFLYLSITSICLITYLPKHLTVNRSL